jgi:transposase-like protein
MIKCPNCGSTAQVKKNIPFTDKDGNYINQDYYCGCGCYFNEEKHYLFEDLETGERFLVSAKKSSEALALAEENFENPLYLGKLTEEEAEASGLDEY